MVLRRVVYVNNGGNILFLSGVSLLFLSLFLFFMQRERHCHHTDLVFFQDSVLLKRELLKTATLNVPGVRPGYGMGSFFRRASLSVVSFYSIFRPALGEASSGSFYRAARLVQRVYHCVASLDHREILE